MRFAHPERPGRTVRLAYCLNVHPGDDLDAVLGGMRAITAPLARRLGGSGAFGVGPYLPAAVARTLRGDEAARAAWLDFLDEHALDAFTFNAFPFGGFHRPGLKAGVFRPTWLEPERAAFTADVAALAAEAWRRGDGGAAHVSVSTHAGMHRSDLAGSPGGDDRARDACAAALARAAAALAELEAESGCRVVLAVEPEPRSLANDTTELVDLRRRALEHAGDAGALLQRHLGTCLDACHAAVEFEDAGAAWSRAVAGGAPLGKIQFSSALALADGADDAGRARLLALDEEVYLHQVTARTPDGALHRAGDLPEAAALPPEGEWRCHFHVPVDLAGVDDLATTRAFADELLRVALADPERWGSPELHVEIETYTWEVLPAAARGPGAPLDGLEREYRHVLALLADAGWRLV